MFASSAKRAVESFFDALNNEDVEAVSGLCTSDGCFNDCMFESVRGNASIVAFISQLRDAQLALRAKPRSITQRGPLMLVKADMQSNDPRFCGPLQLTFTMQGARIRTIDAHRGADAASIIRLYRKQHAA